MPVTAAAASSCSDTRARARALITRSSLIAHRALQRRALNQLRRSPRPAAPRIAQPLALIAYGGLVVWDVIVASVQVARIIVFMPKDQIKSAFIAVPIDLPSPQAITILAGTITLTPGTLTADISSDGSVLLIHALHAPDPVATRDDIKSRYEARLKRIFA
jgi:multicomponent K+:H+ antiporter subunit E